MLSNSVLKIYICLQFQTNLRPVKSNIFLLYIVYFCVVSFQVWDAIANWLDYLTVLGNLNQFVLIRDGKVLRVFYAVYLNLIRCLVFFLDLCFPGVWSQLFIYLSNIVACLCKLRKKTTLCVPGTSYVPTVCEPLPCNFFSCA